jgi:hypothetical protein
MEENWRCCPSCGRSRRGPQLQSPLSDLDLDVRRDHQRTSGCMVVLAVIGVLGILYFIGLGMNWGPRAGGMWATLLIGLLFCAGISALRVYTRPQPPTGGQGVGRVLFGTLALAGAVIGAGLLLLLAIGLFLFVVCLAGAGRGWH